jgi:hypothetical protein
MHRLGAGTFLVLSLMPQRKCLGRTLGWQMLHSQRRKIMLKSLASLAVVAALSIGASGIATASAEASDRIKLNLTSAHVYMPAHYHSKLQGKLLVEKRWVRGKLVVIKHIPPHGPCAYYRVKAQTTNSPYWWHKLDRCRVVHGIN